MKPKMRTKIKQKTLPNGIRVFVHYSDETSFASYSVGFSAGAKYVKNKESGLAHFCEHCIMNSTKKHSDVELARMEKDLAATSNAATGRYIMQFSGSGFAKDIYKLLDITFERIYEPAFDKTETEEEKGIVCQEIERRINDKQYQKFILINEYLYPKTHLSANYILGTTDGVKNVSTKDLRGYVKKRFTAKNMVVCVTGNVDINKLCRYLLQKFGKKAAKPTIVKEDCEVITAGNKFLEVNVICNNQCIIEIHVTDSFKRGTKDALEMYMLSKALTRMGKESPLVKRVREEKQLVYSIGTDSDVCGKSEYFAIFFETTKLEEVFKEICDVLFDVATNGVSEEILLWTKQSIKKEILRRQEDIYGSNPQNIASKLILGKDCSMEFLLRSDEILLNLTNDDIKHAAKRLLQKNRIVIATDSNVFGRKDSKKFMKYYNKACEIAK